MRIANTDVRQTRDGGYLLSPRAEYATRQTFNFFGKDRALWRHQTRMPDGRDRDWQRTKVYGAERAVRRGAPMSWADTLRFVAKVLNSATFQRRWGRWDLEVLDGRGRSSAAAFGNSTITLPKWARTKDVILHELAHAICPNWEQHGRLFARTFLELVKLYMGKPEHDRLRDAFREAGVRFTPRRKATFTRARSKKKRRGPIMPRRGQSGIDLLDDLLNGML